MHIGLVAVDVDGTLLTDQRELTPATCAAVKYTMEEGIEVVIATGRTLGELGDILPRLPQIRYAVLGAGGAIVDCKSRREIASFGVSPQELCRCYDALAPFACMFEPYALDTVYVDREIWSHHEDFTAVSPAPPPPNSRTPVEHLRQWMGTQQDNFLKAHVYFPDTESRDTALEALAHMPLSIMTSNDFDIEIMAQGVDKGTGLAYLAQYLKVPTDQVMAVGDSGNDEAMLDFAGVSAVMANGSPHLKAKADIIADTNQEEGVAKLLGTLLAGALLPESYDNRIYMQ